MRINILQYSPVECIYTVTKSFVLECYMPATSAVAVTLLEYSKNKWRFNLITEKKILYKSNSTMKHDIQMFVKIHDGLIFYWDLTLFKLFDKNSSFGLRV
jgi:hypothetical protein